MTSNQGTYILPLQTSSLQTATDTVSFENRRSENYKPTSESSPYPVDNGYLILISHVWCDGGYHLDECELPNVMTLGLPLPIPGTG